MSWVLNDRVIQQDLSEDQLNKTELGLQGGKEAGGGGDDRSFEKHFQLWLPHLLSQPESLRPLLNY